jgi:hypothetical protein
MVFIIRVFTVNFPKFDNGAAQRLQFWLLYRCGSLVTRRNENACRKLYGIKLEFFLIFCMHMNLSKYNRVG